MHPLLLLTIILAVVWTLGMALRNGALSFMAPWIHVVLVMAVVVFVMWLGTLVL